MSDDSISSELLTVAGYREGKLKYDYGFADVNSSNIIYHNADAVKGNSGGPVFYYDHGHVYAVAIHVAENTYLQKNIARRITGRLFDSMKDDGIFD